jgi:hypothetical protein
VSVKYREVFFPAIFLGDEMLEIGHWVPQKNLLGNVEITVIRVFFIFIISLFSQAND